MRRELVIAIIMGMFLFNVKQINATVIAGSSGISPPPFWENSYWGMTSGLERAFLFTTISDGPFYAEELQVAAFYPNFQSGSHARFSIKLDDNGLPGVAIWTFETKSITTIPQVLGIEITDEIILNSNTTYWLTGQSLQQNFHWNLGDNTFGTTAYRISQGEWIILPNRNVSAYAILGSPTPEPSTLLLFGLGALFLRKKR